MRHRREMLCWSLLLLCFGCATGFHFPDEEIFATDFQDSLEEENTTGTFVDYDASADYDYDPDNVVDPGTGELEGRFFGGKKKWAQLGDTARAFLHTLTKGPEQVVPDRPVQSGLTASIDDYDSSPDYDSPVNGVTPEGFPIDASGTVDCSRVPKYRKRACRKARRQYRRQGQRRPGRGRGGRGNRGGRVNRPGTSSANLGSPRPGSSGPDPYAMEQAMQRCCPTQMSGDLLAFNRCCHDFGFCPICPVDPVKLAQEECCPYLARNDQRGHRQCCSKHGRCPDCTSVLPPAGCVYKGKTFKVGSQMDKLSYKCLFLKCKDNGQGPEPVLEYLPAVGCCEQGQNLFSPNRSIQVDECTNRVCRDGEWVEETTDLAAVFAHPCPEGWLNLGGSCVYIWRELMTWTNASRACGRLLGSLFLPQNQAQLSQLITAFNNMEDRDSNTVLGGWVDARDSGRQWQTSTGDTLTFTPWEEGSPDRKRRTACAGLTVTSRSQGWKDYFCDSKLNMMYPICSVEKQGCGSTREGCQAGGESFAPNTVISATACETIKCNKDSYPVREVNPACCYHHIWYGEPFVPDRGWHAGLYPDGVFTPYPGFQCHCIGGLADCSQSFGGDYDYDDYDGDY